MTSRDERLLMQRRLRAAIAPSGNLETVLDTRLAGLEPFAADVGTKMAAILDEIAVPIWPRLRDRLHPLPDDVILENAWATVAHKPFWIALINRSVRLSDSQRARERLDRLVPLPGDTRQAAPDYSWAARPAYECDSDLPPFVGLNELPWRIRARFGLAALAQEGASPSDLLEAASRIATPDVGGVAEALHTSITHTGTAAHTLTVAQMARLDATTRALLQSSPALRQIFLPAPTRRSNASRPDLEAYRARYEAATNVFQSASRALEQLAWAEAGRIVQEVVPDEVTLAAAEDALRLPDRSQPTPPAAVSFKPLGASPRKAPRWTSMTSAQAKHLARFLPGNMVPSIWSTALPRVVSALADGTLISTDFSPAERSHFDQCMSARHRGRLARAERFEWVATTDPIWVSLALPTVLRAARQRPEDAVELLKVRLSAFPDAGPILEHFGNGADPIDVALVRRTFEATAPVEPPRRLDAWTIATAPFIGTKAWRRALDHGAASQPALEHMLGVLEAGIAPAAPNAFLRLLDAAVFDPSASSADRAHAIARWLKCEPTRVGALARRLDAATAAALADLPPTLLATPLLQELSRSSSSEMRDALWDGEVARVANAPDLIREVLSRAAESRIPKWIPGWARLTGTDVERATALALAARKSASRLQSLAKMDLGTGLTEGLAEAARLLPHACKAESVYLELLSVIGVAQAPSLAWVIAHRRRDATPGHRVDHMYVRHQLPKDSGGTRTISVPDDRLKRVQRAVLHGPLERLGAHPCAFGFVTARSIRDNAQVHVGQTVVANADVRNCFPSVRWPLVRAALRRDLGATLSPAAISILVDLCTADGGLPIGAPTSPALLNRVLYKTDEILAAAAQRRGCNYSRYADDLSFSGNHEAVRMLGVAGRCLGQIGLELDPKKTNIFRRGRRQVCTGLVVNDQVSIPRRLRRRLRAAVHAAEFGRVTHWHGKPATLPQLKGRLAFLQMIHPREGFELRNRLASTAAHEEPGDDAHGTDDGESNDE